MSIDNVVVACILGDGHVSARGRISLHHSAKQKDLLLHKVELLTAKGYKFRVYESEQMSYGSMRHFVRADGYASQSAKQLRALLYPQGVKTAPQQWVEQFTFADWAILYMDDGRQNVLSHTKNILSGVRTKVDCAPFVNRYEICTEAFDDVSKFYLCNSLLSLGVESAVDKRGRLVIRRAESKVTFFTGIAPYVIPSMQYKLSAIPTLSYKPQ